MSRPPVRVNGVRTTPEPTGEPVAGVPSQRTVASAIHLLGLALPIVWAPIMNTLAVLLAVSAIADRSPDLVLIGGLVVLLLIVARVYWDRRGMLLNRTKIAPTGSWLTSRMLLTVAVAGVLAHQETSDLMWLLVGALGLTTVAEQMISVLAGGAYPVLLHYPGRDARALPWFAAPLVFASNVVSLTLVGLTAVLHLPIIVALLPQVLVVLVTVAAGLDAGLLLLARLRTESRLKRLLTTYGPTFALHWQAPGGTAYQVAMWLPYLERLAERLDQHFVVIVRTEQNLHDVRELTTAPVVLRKPLEDLDDVVVPSLKTVFYVNTATNNCHMVHYSHLNHIQLNHGDSDKAPSSNAIFRMFDRNFVAGQAAIDRFAARGVQVPDDLFAIVGRPQVEQIELARAPIGDIEAPHLLYAPTWSGFFTDNDYSSLPVGHDMVAAAVDRGCTVLFRPHPYARRSATLSRECDRIAALLERDRTVHGRPHVVGVEAEQHMSIVECCNWADVLIADVSSVVADFLYSEKPFAMAAVLTPTQGFAEEFPIARAAYVADAHQGRLTGFASLLDDMLGADPLADRRREVKSYYLGDIAADRYAQRFFDEAARYL